MRCSIACPRNILPRDDETAVNVMRYRHRYRCSHDQRQRTRIHYRPTNTKLPIWYSRAGGVLIGDLKGGVPSRRISKLSWIPSPGPTVREETGMNDVLFRERAVGRFEISKKLAELVIDAILSTPLCIESPNLRIVQMSLSDFSISSMTSFGRLLVLTTG